MPDTLESVFRPTPPQEIFLRSEAFIRGYGGAMGGGKSRTMCEVIFDYALDHPGLTALLARDAHTSIVGTTKRTMLEQVIPADAGIIAHQKASMGEDYIELYNGSKIHFIGMDNPYRWYSSEISIFALDEAQELSNAEVAKVVRLISRLRERCRDCVRDDIPDCKHMPHKAMLAFNPSSPGHWLQQWFLNEAERTEYGYRKAALMLDDADEPIGDCEFVFALAKDNPYLSPDYMAMLRGFPARERRRYLEGLWEYTEGTCFFDLDALAEYQQLAAETKALLNGRPVGDIEADFVHRARKGSKPEDPIKFEKGSGPLTIWKAPIRSALDTNGEKLPGHRYVVAVDAASGSGADYTAIQVVDMEELEQVAEVQAKLPPSDAAEWAYRIGRVYNDAVIVCEVTGGWGLAVDLELRKLHYPRPYTRRVLDRLTKRFTDKLGFDTTKKTRPLLLSLLEEAIRERSLGIYSMRTVGELGSFVWSEKERPEAREGCNDDLVMALALAVFVCQEQPKQLRRQKDRPHQAQFAATGY